MKRVFESTDFGSRTLHWGQMRGPLIRANVRVAVDSLAAFWQRAALALVGIVFGVGAVIAMISVGLIVRNEVVLQFQELGTDVLTIRLRSDRSTSSASRGISVGAAEGIDRLSTVEAAAPYAMSSGPVFRGGKGLESVEFVGATAAFADLSNLSVAQGRFISDLDHHRYYCVIGAELAAILAGPDTGRLIGESVIAGDAIYTVIGIMPATPQGQRDFAVDRSIIIPLSTALRVFGQPGIQRITARMPANVHYETAAEEITGYFGYLSDHLRVRVRSAEALIEQMYEQTRLFTLLLGTSGGIALLIGAIGVMNVMLLSVSSRSVEIGIRRALGALRQDIQWQFLIESLILSAIGGLLGILLGVGASYLICLFAGWAFLVSATAIAIGVGVTVTVGIFSGFYPAWLASRLDITVALQNK